MKKGRRAFLKGLSTLGIGFVAGGSLLKDLEKFTENKVSFEKTDENLVIIAKEYEYDSFYYAPETNEKYRCITCNKPVKLSEHEEHLLHHVYEEALEIRKQAKRGKFSET